MKQKQVVLVTGGSREIGLGIASRLAVDGCRLMINGVRGEAEVRYVILDLKTLGAEAAYCQADVGRAADRERLLNTVRERFGRLDVPVNNAGITSPDRKDALEVEEDDLDHVLAVNLKGPYFLGSSAESVGLTRAAARWMIEQSEQDLTYRGVIINVNSISATVVSTNRAEYCMSKAALAMATQLWAARLAEFGIDVYEVRPGVIETDMTAPVKAKYDKLIAEGLTLEPRWGLPQDVGRAVAMLARGDLPYATGQVLTIDGGLTMPRL